jgi:hypothetical protein
VRAIDTNRSRNDAVRDSLFVDDLFIRSLPSA